MHLPNNQPEFLSAQALHIKSLATELVIGLKEIGLTENGPSETEKTLTLINVTDILADQAADRIFLIKSGRVLCQQSEKLVYTADAGDFIGLFRARQLTEGAYSCDGEVELAPYNFTDLEQHCGATPERHKCWLDYLTNVACFFGQALAHEIPKQFKPATGFLQFDQGDIIISQGEQAECVYHLLEGGADVMHDGVKVGEIKEEETFGAMAVFTKQVRNATVVATSSCSVLAVRQDEFLDLARHQPHVCISLIEEMADKINQLNHQVLDLKK